MNLPDVWLTLILILARVLSFLTTAPVFNRRNVPALAKVGLGFFISLMVLSRVPDVTLYDTAGFVFALVAEVAVGLAAGALTDWLFLSLTMGGQLMDQQAGFGTAAIFDPSMSLQLSLLSTLLLYLALFLMLQLNAHHVLVMGVVRSFEVVPPGHATLSTALLPLALRTITAAFGLFMRVAAPVVAVVMLTDITLGMVGRTVPQLNVLMLGLPVKAATAMLVFAAVSPALMGIGDSLMAEIELGLLGWIGVMGP